MELSIRFPHLNLALGAVGTSVRIGSFELSWYGIFLAAGMLLGVWFLVIEAKRTNQNQDRYLELLLWMIPAGVLGARLSYVLLGFEYYRNHPAEILNLRQGGMLFYGALAGGILAAALFAHKKKASFWQIGDTVCIGLLSGQILGRFGCFFSREAFGGYTDGLLAMQLPVTAVRPGDITEGIWAHTMTVGGVEYIQVHPVFLYEMLWNLLLLTVLTHCRRRKRFTGELLLIYLAGFSVGQVIFAGLRTDALLLRRSGIPAVFPIAAVLAAGCSTVLGIKLEMAKRRKAAEKARREKRFEQEQKEADTNRKTDTKKADVL